MDAMDDPGQITVLLGRMRDGDVGARDALVPLVYRDLEKIASAYANRPGMSIEPRGLVHELYVRLAATPITARDRKHFYTVAALAMRQILVDRARRKRAHKRGRDVDQVTMAELAVDAAAVDVVVVDEALRRLEELSPRQARIVELRCLVGLSVGETDEVLGVSERTVHVDWRLARAWLVLTLQESQ